MKIKRIEGIKPEKLHNAIVRWFNRPNGRFIIRASYSNDKTGLIDIEQVRLRAPKEFCGNHPAACEIGNPKHRKGRYLEGADWVQFNDELNNILDRLNVSASVASSAVILRKGRLRRINYTHHYPRGHGNAQWDKDSDDPSDWQDFCGRYREAPVSDLPYGTPGVYRKAGHAVVG